MTAEIFGRETGLGRGRGGHMHLFDPATHFSCSGIIAEGYPPALGQAFAFRARAPTGSRWPSPARARPTRARSTSRSTSPRCGSCRSSSSSRTTTGASRSRARPRPRWRPTRTARRRTACPAERVEDNDVEAVYDAAGRAVARARAGDGPSLIEVHTLRLWGHFEGDAQGYRPDLADVPGRDPIPRYEQTLREAGVLDDAVGRRGSRRRRWRASRRRSTFAKDSPLPDPADATAYVFA